MGDILQETNKDFNMKIYKGQRRRLVINHPALFGWREIDRNT